MASVFYYNRISGFYLTGTKKRAHGIESFAILPYTFNRLNNQKKREGFS